MEKKCKTYSHYYYYYDYYYYYYYYYYYWNFYYYRWNFYYKSYFWYCLACIQDENKTSAVRRRVWSKLVFASCGCTVLRPRAYYERGFYDPKKHAALTRNISNVCIIMINLRRSLH